MLDYFVEMNYLFSLYEVINNCLFRQYVMYMTIHIVICYIVVYI